MGKRRILSLIFTICLFVTDSFAINKVTFFESLTVKDGLSQMSILDILQDSKGYMWFATRDGLNRYDGYTFDVFQNIENDSLSLSNNYVLAITEDEKKNLWVGTLFGLNYFDRNTETCRRFFHSPKDEASISNNHIRKIYIDSSSRIWIGTGNGLNLYNRESGKFTRYFNTNDIADKRINTILEVDNRLLIGTDTDLYIFNPEDGSAIIHPASVNRKLSIKALFKDKDGHIYAGTFNDGLFELDGLKDIKTQYLHNPLAMFSLSNNSVRCISEDLEGNLLIGTFNGINIFDRKTGYFQSYKQESGLNNGLIHFSFHSIYCDRAGTVWIGSWAGGINYFNYRKNNYLEYHVPANREDNLLGIVGAMVEDQNGVWIGMEGGGLLFFDTRLEKYTHYAIGKSSPNDIRSNIVNSLYKRGDILYVGTNNGVLAEFDTRKRQFVKSIKLPGVSSIVTMNSDSEGNLLIGLQASKGLLKVSPEGKVTDTFFDDKGNLLVFNSICSIIKDTTDVYLLGSNSRGFYRYNFRTKEYSLHDLTLSAETKQQEGPRSISTNQLFKDSRGWLWVATPQQGVFCLDREYKLLKQYTMSNGLNSNTICGIVEDKNNDIWFSVSSEIFRINMKDGSLKGFKGFRLNEFALLSCFSTGDQLFFGGNMGFVVFTPDDIKQNTDIPPIVVKGLSINNKPLKLQEHDFLHNTTILDYNQTNIAIEYRALEYIHPEQTTYAYMLQGFDSEWNMVGNRLAAHYTNLPAGDYIFKVKAANSDGIWNDEGASISIKVLPPPWKTWWAYLLYSIAFIGVVLAYVRYLTMRVKLTNDIAMKEREQENAEKLHTDRINLFTNFSHELRTPLTLIISPLEEINQRVDLPQSIKGSMGLMYKNARRLLLLVNQLMDFRKREAGSMNLSVAEGDFTLFIQEIVLAFSELAKSRNIELSYHDRDMHLMLWYDRYLMEKVMFNLLSNAFKNTPDGGRIEIGVQLLRGKDEKQEVEVSVIDTGIGIPQDKLKEIFDPFYQINDNREGTTGTGIGLNLTQGIIELHHGRIWAESPPGEGARFYYTLLMGRGHFTGQEIIDNYKSSEDISSYTAIDERVVADNTDTEQTGKKKYYTVLVAEDNAEVRHYIKNVLKKEYNVIEASDGEEALDKAIKRMPDLVVSDIMMPKMDGIQLCHELKQDLRTGHIPVILLTARTTIMQIEEGLKIGADDYITKPFSPKILMARIKNLIDSRNKLRELYGKNFNAFDTNEKVTSADDRFLEKLYKVMDENLSNPEFNIEKFCKEIGMSKTNLYTKIKALTNLSPTEFARLSRLQSAAKILQQSDIPVSEVSLMVGFNNHSYFTSSFRAVYGMSPSDYAKKYKTSPSSESDM